MPPQRKQSIQPPPRPSSPGGNPPPPHSPISPKAVAAKLANMEPYNAPRVMARPPEPVPIAESDNPDVIALRSALMILQVQRETAKRDIKELAKLKDEAVKDPEAYVKELVRREQHGAQKSRSGGQVKEDLLAPTLRYLVDGLGKESEYLRSETEAQSGPAVQQSKDKQRTGGLEDEDSDDSDDSEAPKSNFATAPKAQNVYRMPPINWAKYQLAGAGLEKLHHDQQTKPTPGQPTVPSPDGQLQTERYVMAAPYQPVVDGARMGNASDHPMQTRRKGSKR
jgi:hypothetical protein